MKYEPKHYSPFSSSMAATFISSMMYDLNTKICERGKKLANEIVKFGADDIAIRNFIMDFDYMVEEMAYLQHLGESDGLDMSDSVYEKSIKEKASWETEKICEWFTTSDFNWEEKRWYTDEEKKKRNDEINKIAKEVLAELLEEEKQNNYDQGNTRYSKQTTDRTSIK